MKQLTNRFSLSLNDGSKALVMLLGTAALTYVQTLIPGWDIPTEIKGLIATVITYVLKNFLTNDVPHAVAVIEKAEIKEAEKVRDDIAKEV